MNEATNLLAGALAARLRRTLTATNMETVIRRNRAEADPNVCHSHDVIDANEVMAEAWSDVFGDECVPSSDAAVRLWNEAWRLARTREFRA